MPKSCVFYILQTYAIKDLTQEIEVYPDINILITKYQYSSVINTNA